MTFKDIVKEMKKKSCYNCRFSKIDSFACVSTCKVHDDELIRQPEAICENYVRYDVEEEFNF